MNRKKTIEFKRLSILFIVILGFYSCKDKEVSSQQSLNKIQKTEKIENYEILVTGSYNMDADFSYSRPLIKFNLTDSLFSLKIGSEKTINLSSYDTIIPSLFQLTKLLNDSLNLKNNEPYHFYNASLRPSESIDLIKLTKDKTERKQISGHRFTNEKHLKYLELDSLELKMSNVLHYILINIVKNEWQDTISRHELKEVNSLIEALKDPENIYKLNLRGKNIKSIPPEIGKLKNLEVLNFSGSGVRFISKEIEQCKKLKSIIGNSSNLREIPSTLGNLKNLRVLKLDYCKLKHIPKEIGNIESLWDLSIGHNNISTIPNEFTKLKNLTSLDISNNPLGKFPSCILKMENLKRFWMFGTKIKEIPFEIKNLNYLDHVRINKKIIQNLDSLTSLMPEVMFFHND